MSVLKTGGMVAEVTEEDKRVRRAFRPIRKKKPAPRDVHPENPSADYKFLLKLFPHYAPAEIRAKLDSLRCTCQSNEVKFCRYRREAWFTWQRGLERDRHIRTKQRLAKADVLFKFFLIQHELNQIWDFLQHKSKEDYPEKPLPLGQFTTFDSSY